MDPEIPKPPTIHDNLAALLLDAIPTDVKLFHYTDAGGLMGMLQHQQLWMTSLHYQNDEQEYYYTFNLFKKIMRNNYPELLTEKQLENFGTNTSATFTFSLSEKKDLLSQWRGYCPNGGFAISFEKEKLNKVISDNHLKVAKCIYDKDVQRDFIIKNVIDITPEEYEEAKLRSGGIQGAFGRQKAFLTGYGGSNYLSELAAILKHPSFSQEKEWRLIKTLDRITKGPNLSDVLSNSRYKNASIDVRISKNKLLPYQTINLKDDNNPINLSEVVVSPNPHKALSLDDCRILLAKYDSENYHNAKVKNSKIPYVNW